MRWRKKATGPPSIEEAFAPFQQVELQHVPAFEMFLLGGIIDFVKAVRPQHLVGERDASRLFAVIPNAVGMAVSDAGNIVKRVPRWDASEVPGLTELRRAFVASREALSQNPSGLMVRLVPIYQRELAHYAGNLTGQVRSSWVMTMAQLVKPGVAGQQTHEDALRAYGQAVQRWELAAGMA